MSKYIDKPIRVKFQGGREGGWINADVKVTHILMFISAGGNDARLDIVSLKVIELILNNRSFML